MKKDLFLKKVVAVLAAGALVFSLAGCAAGGASSGKTGSDVVVNFLNWGDYIDSETVPAFEQANPGIKINMTTTDSNEAMYAIAATEGSQINVMIPSEYMLQRMMAENMLAEIDTAKLENFKYVKDFTAENCGYDPDGKYSIPYSWGTFGIVYNTTMVSAPITDWESLFDPQYSGKILMYDSIRDSIGVALLEKGYSLNSENQQEIDAATELLISQKPLVLAYGTDDLRMTMTNGSAAMAVMYAGDAAYAMKDNTDLAYVVPEDGANIFVDGMCITKNTTGEVYDAALKFLNFMLTPEIAAKNAEYTGYSTPEPAALELVSEEVKSNNAFNPEGVDLSNAEYYKHLEKDVLKMYEEAWMKVKAS